MAPEDRSKVTTSCPDVGNWTGCTWGLRATAGDGRGLAPRTGLLDPRGGLPPRGRSSLLASRSLLHDVSRGLGLVTHLIDTPESRRSSSATLARETRVSEILEATLASRVRQASLRQAAYGFLTTDPVKSAYYLGQKLHKAFLSWHDKKDKRL